jgi:hypothetical protein
MFDRMREELFIRPNLDVPYITVNEVEEVVPQFLKRVPAQHVAASSLVSG